MLATPELVREAAQSARLEELLPRWRETPLYRTRLPEAGHLPTARESFSRLPFITKHDIRREFPRNFLRAGMDLDALLDEELVELEHTSGTSEERTPLLLPRGWWSEQEQRALRLNRFVAEVLDEFPGTRRVTITPPVCGGDICYTSWPSRPERVVGSALYVNLSKYPFLWSDEDLARMAQEAADWAPQFLDMDPVYGVRFALYCEQRGIRLPSLQFTLSSYEFLSVVHRRILRRVFGVPVFNLYGSTETGHLLMENERGEMKPSYDNAFLEVVSPDERGVGDLVVTTLTNDYLPRLRYRIGDLVERRELSYATTYVVHGRTCDTLQARDGRRVTTWQVDDRFAGVEGIAHYQLRQGENGDCLMRYVPDGDGPGAEDLKGLAARLETLLQVPDRVVTEAVNLLVPTPSGKFCLTYRV